MTKRITTKRGYAGNYVAEIQVELMEDETGWTPYLSVEDAKKVRGIL